VTDRPVRPVRPGCPVVVMGLMGAGKSTLGAALAQGWGLPLHDSDVDLLAGTGRTARALAADLGAERLHDLEADHLLGALAGGPGVIAAAASTIERLDCRRALADHAVMIWIDAPVDLLVGRQARGGHRPQFAADLRAMLTAMDAARRPLFLAAADLVVPCGTRAEEVSARVLDVTARRREGGAATPQ